VNGSVILAMIMKLYERDNSIYGYHRRAEIPIKTPLWFFFFFFFFFLNDLRVGVISR